MTDDMMASLSPVEYAIDSKKYEKLYNDHCKKLVRSIDPTDELIYHIRRISSLAGKLDGIKNEKTTTKVKALIILELPIGEDTETIKSFISALCDNDHKHVAEVFIKESAESLLSDDRYELLVKKRIEVRKYHDPESGILDQLECRGVFSKSDTERVKETEKTWDEKAAKIIDILSCKANSAFDQFIEALTEVGQEHVVYVLTGEGSPPIDDKSLSSLSKYSSEIRDRMDSVNCPLVGELVTRNVFTKFDKQRVETEKVGWRRNERILDIIERKPQSAFEGFLQALCDTDQDHVVNLIQPYVEANGLLHPEANGSAEQQAIDNRLEEQMQQDPPCNQDSISKALGDIGVEATGTSPESIRIKFTLRSVSHVKQLKGLISSGELDRLFTESYCPLFVHGGLKSISVEIRDEEFERCSKEMDRLARMTAQHREALEVIKKEMADKVEVNAALLEYLSLCKYRKQSILGSTDKVQVLMDVMKRRPDSEFQELLHAFRATRQTDAVKFLTGFYSHF